MAYVNPYGLQFGTVAGSLADGATLASTTALATGGIQSSRIGAVNGVGGLDATARMPFSQLPVALSQAIYFVGLWNAATNVPALTSATIPAGQSTGAMYKVSVASTTATLDGVTGFLLGDEVIVSNATGTPVWSRLDGSPITVNSVVGAVGAITLANLTAGGVAPLNSANLTGTPNAPTPVLTDSSTALATTAWVKGQNYGTATGAPTYTGDVTNGAGTTVMTLNTVFASPGTYSKVTVNAKGLVTGTVPLAVADITAALGGSAALTAAQIDAPNGVTGRGAYGQNSFGGVTTNLILRGTSTSGAAVRLTADNSGTATTANSFPIAPNTGGRITGRWQVKNTANGDVVGGDFSVTISRGAGAPVLGNVNGASSVSVFDATGTTLTGAPLIVLASDSSNSSLSITWPGFAALTCDVRCFVDDGIVY